MNFFITLGTFTDLCSKYHNCSNKLPNQKKRSRLPSKASRMQLLWRSPSRHWFKSAITFLMSRGQVSELSKENEVTHLHAFKKKFRLSYMRNGWRLSIFYLEKRRFRWGLAVKAVQTLKTYQVCKCLVITLKLERAKIINPHKRKKIIKLQLIKEWNSLSKSRHEETCLL